MCAVYGARTKTKLKRRRSKVKWFVYIIFILLYLLVTFFGLGPVLLADGTQQERMMTLVIVLILYALLTIGFRIFMKRFK